MPMYTLSYEKILNLGHSLIEGLAQEGKLDEKTLRRCTMVLITLVLIMVTMVTGLMAIYTLQLACLVVGYGCLGFGWDAL